jgi:hypothetical protein
MRYRPLSPVPIHKQFSRSFSSEGTTRVLLSSPCATKGFNLPCYSCCNPRTGPDLYIPTHREPSDAKARDAMPLPPLDLRPWISYEVDEPGFQRRSRVTSPDQKFPKHPRLMGHLRPTKPHRPCRNNVLPGRQPHKYRWLYSRPETRSFHRRPGQ